MGNNNYNFRNSIDGRFVKESYSESHKETTEREKVKRSKIGDLFDLGTMGGLSYGKINKKGNLVGDIFKRK